MLSSSKVALGVKQVAQLVVPAAVQVFQVASHSVHDVAGPNQCSKQPHEPSLFTSAPGVKHVTQSVIAAASQVLQSPWHSVQKSAVPNHCVLQKQELFPCSVAPVLHDRQSVVPKTRIMANDGNSTLCRTCILLSTRAGIRPYPV